MKNEIVIGGVKYVRADSVEKTLGVNWSYGVNRSNGVNGSYGVNRSDGVNGSDGVNWSDGVNRSNGVNGSYGVNGSNGVNWSHGVNGSYGVNWSYGVNKSAGVNRSVFVSNQRAQSLLFNKPVDESRVSDVMESLLQRLCGWRPKYNDIHKLYLANGSDWKLTPISEAKELSKEEAWADMPKEAIDYLKSIPEFDAQVFFEVTGLKV
jgi:hypothetical protein